MQIFQSTVKNNEQSMVYLRALLHKLLLHTKILLLFQEKMKWCHLNQQQLHLIKNEI